MSFQRFRDFINDSYKTTCTGIAKKVTEYTDNLPAFLLLLKEMHNLTTCTATKSRVTRLINNIQENFDEEDL